MRFGSLFAGVGGFDLGLERAGMESAWQVEIDPFRRKVLAYHWPNTERYEDVTTVSDLTAVDLICGGFPCQDLSVAGRRAGLSGSRSGLWWEFDRIIGEVRPTWVLIENVPGLLSSNGGDDFALILSALGERGYGYAYRILDSRHFGVPQRRRRVYVVGHFSGRCDYPAAVLFESASGSGDSQTGRAEGQGVAGPVGDGASLPRSGTWKGADHETYVSDVAYSITRREHKGVSQREGVTNLAVNNGVRRLTPVECERLQGFPDGWTDLPSKDGPRYAAMGDAVTVNVIQWIGERILKV